MQIFTNVEFSVYFSFKSLGRGLHSNIIWIVMNFATQFIVFPIHGVVEYSTVLFFTHSDFSLKLYPNRASKWAAPVHNGPSEIQSDAWRCRCRSVWLHPKTNINQWFFTKSQKNSVKCVLIVKNSSELKMKMSPFNYSGCWYLSATFCQIKDKQIKLIWREATMKSR